MKNTKHIRDFIREHKGVSGVYAIVCTKTWRSYVGSSVNIGSRVRAHIGDLRNNHHVNGGLQQDFNLYSINSFYFELLEICEELELLEIENKYYNLGCNLYNTQSPLLEIPKYTIKDQKRFWKKINIKNVNECWPVLKPSKTGYGSFRLKRKLYSFHRIAYLFTYNNINNIVCHSCNNKSCCNPKHLYCGSYRDNTRDNIQISDKCINIEQVSNLRKYYIDNPNKKLSDIYDWFTTTYNVNIKKGGMIQVLSNSSWYDSSFEKYKHQYTPIRKHQTKLNWTIVNEMRQMWHNVKNKRKIYNFIIDKYKIDITESMVQDIIRNNYWKDKSYNYEPSDETFDSWSDEDYSFLKDNHQSMSITEITNNLKYCRHTVRKKLKQLNLYIER